MVKYLNLLAIALLIFSSVPLRAEQKNQVILEKVEAHLSQGEPKKAIKLLSERIKSNPEDIELLNKRAEIFIFIQREKDAMTDIKKVLSIDNSSCGAYLNKARLFYHIDMPDSAISFIDKGLASAQSPEELESLCGLKGGIYLAQGESVRAEESLLKASATGVASLGTMRDLAAALSENKKHDEAMMIIRQSLQIFGADLEPLINAGFLSNKIGLYDEAIDYLKDALAIDPHNPYALANLADAYAQIGGLDLAYKSIEKSLQNDPTNAFAFKIKGDCLVKMGENARACKEYKKAISTGYAVLYGSEGINALMIESCATR